MPFKLNPTLKMIRDSLCPPWTKMVPGWELAIPFCEYEDDNKRSQAPTRQQSMEPAAEQPAAVRLPAIPETVEEEDKRSKTHTRRKRETTHHYQYFITQQAKRGHHLKEQATKGRRVRPRAQSLSPPGRISAQNYAATEVNGAYGLIDDGQQGGAQVLIVHASRKDPTSILRIRQGDSIQALSTLHKGGFALLKVLFITRTQYFQPGRKVTSITIGVPKNDWDILQVHRPKFVRTL